MSKQTDLIAYVCDSQPHLLSPALLRWMDVSPRFTTFVETYRDKIRKKIRVTPEPERVLDLRAELEAAYWLLNDRRLELAYEPYASEKRRGPDFAVTYRVNLVFNLEVARIRAEAGEEDPINLPRNQERILRSLLDKLGQMQPGIPNLLLIHSREELARAIDLNQLMQSVKTRVEGKDPAFFAASRSPNRYASPAAFYKDFLRLSGILLWATGSQGSGPVAEPWAQAWLNKQARPAFEEKVLRRIRALLSGESGP